MKDTQQPTQTKSEIFTYEDGDDAWVESLDRKIGESKSYWESEYKLETKSKENEKIYLGEDELDSENEDEYLDNRIFSSVRTIVPYVTTRITEPEVYPSSKAPAAKRFAEDFEKALHIKASMEKLRAKLKFSLEDAIIRRRGYLKLRYDAQTGNFCKIEFVPAESIIIDHNAKTYDEPRYFRHLLDMTIRDMITMFPDREDKIKEKYGIDENSPSSKYDECQVVNEDWCFITEDGELDLVVTWSVDKMPLGKMKDPNWNYNGTNFLEHHMMPLVFVNVLNDGRKYIDKTTFVEQASLLQKNVNTRGRQIGVNAGLGSVGMPVVDSEALPEDETQYLSFEEDTVLVLDVPEDKKIGEVFDIWRAGALPSFVYEDKLDSRNGIDNAFGTPNVFRGEQSDNNTLGQDVLVRDQAFGRQQELVDAIDSAMERLYLLVAQFLLIYGSEKEEFKFVGENRTFDYVLLNSEHLDTLVQIRVKAGTSMPIDRAQRRMVADKASAQGMIDPYTYWEIMDESNAEKYAKRLMDYTADPASYMKDIEDSVFNRDAFVDIQILKDGGAPPFRENLPKEYFDYLNRYVLDGNLDNPQIPMDVKEAIQRFIDIQLARGQKMLGMIETQLPTPEEVEAANETADQMNQQDQQAADAEAKTEALRAKTAQQVSKSNEESKKENNPNERR